jgi:hypothetical protein
MNLRTDIVTINHGVVQKIIGVVAVVAGILAAAGGGHGAVPEKWRLIGCLSVVIVGLGLASPTDRLKLDFPNRRYMRVYGWAPFVRFRVGTFDELEGISIRQATRGTEKDAGPFSQVLFLNWSEGLPPFELASFEESRSYDGVNGSAAAEQTAEEYRVRFGFHRMNE